MGLQTQRVSSWRSPYLKGQWMTTPQRWLRKHFSSFQHFSTITAHKFGPSRHSQSCGCLARCEHRPAKPLLLLVFRDCSSISGQMLWASLRGHCGNVHAEKLSCPKAFPSGCSWRPAGASRKTPISPRQSEQQY